MWTIGDCRSLVILLLPIETIHDLLEVSVYRITETAFEVHLAETDTVLHTDNYVDNAQMPTLSRDDAMLLLADLRFITKTSTVIGGTCGGKVLTCGPADTIGCE